MKQKITIEIDLDDIPNWANYITFDMDGMWLHEKMPYISGSDLYNSLGRAIGFDNYGFTMQIIEIKRDNKSNYDKEYQLRSYNKHGKH